MCSTSNVNEMLRHTADGAAAAPTAATVSATRFKHHRQAYFLVDIREADEIAANPLVAPPPGSTEAAVVGADAEMPMGKLLHLAGHGELDASWTEPEKQIVLLCGSGYRSAIAAAELQRQPAFRNTKVFSLSRGLLGLYNDAATVPDFVVVLGTKSSAEKLTLALNACAVAAASGETVVLALIGDGVCTFLRKGSNKEEPSASSFRVEEVFVGEPFQPTHVLLNKFIGTGNGVVLACTSCVKSRGVEFGSDLLNGVQPMQMPDLLRMLGEAKKTLQFM